MTDEQKRASLYQIKTRIHMMLVALDNMDSALANDGHHDREIQRQVIFDRWDEVLAASAAVKEAGAEIKAALETERQEGELT